MKTGNHHITKLPKCLIVIGLFELLYLVMLIQNSILMINSHYTPDYKMVELKPYTEKQLLTSKDYQILFEQTGLAPDAVDTIMEWENSYETLKQYQSNFFRKTYVATSNNPFMTRSEYICSKSGSRTRGFITAPLEDGYILYTPSSSTLGWRNGHIGIVVDADSSLVFEALAPGMLSDVGTAEHWTSYPAFIMLKLNSTITKNNEHLIPDIISTINNKLMGIPYNLFAGVLSSKNPPVCKSSQCAHIIWYAFSLYGLDIDSNKGVIVTPENIANCNLFEVVQIYGVNPSEYSAVK
ncbi:MAG: hypothetical protein HFH14_07405 [Lachnospiraceae bacterium]|nr:hypothetical protein [Lachnospiraceae bacterium]